MFCFLGFSTLGFDSFSDFFYSVLESGFGGCDRYVQDGGNVRETVIAVDTEPDDFGLFLRDSC